MDKDMRQRCILCEQTKPYKWHQSATTFICADCRADAALGRAVRRFSEGMALFKHNPEWAFRQNYSGDIIRLDTPEAVLQAAGLMEVEK